MMFRQLSQQDVQVFRNWARDNYQPFSPIEGIWHPEIQAECARINQERSVMQPEACAVPAV